MIPLVLVVTFLVLVGVPPVLHARRLLAYVRRRMASPAPTGPMPRVSVIVPCKGLDPGFDENMTSVLQQDHPDFEVIFTTATAADAACPALDALLARYPSVRARRVVSGISPRRSQKINNQLGAIAAADPDSRVFAFIDSDVRLKRDFLRRLVEPLTDPKVGATTGFRWYLPPSGKFWGLVRSAWNGGGLPFLTDSRHNYAWGGAMAVRTDTYHQAHIEQTWDQALTDDFPLTLAVKRIGLKVVFVPHCLVMSHEDSSALQTLEWTNRQTTILHVYCPALWWKITLAHLALLIVSVLTFTLSVLFQGPAYAAALLAVLVVTSCLVLVTQTSLVLHAVSLICPEYSPLIRTLFPKYLLSAPFAVGLLMLNTVRSILSRRIRWRGVNYILCSPTRTIVVE